MDIFVDLSMPNSHVNSLVIKMEETQGNAAIIIIK